MAVKYGSPILENNGLFSVSHGVKNLLFSNIGPEAINLFKLHPFLHL